MLATLGLGQYLSADICYCLRMPHRVLKYRIIPTIDVPSLISSCVRHRMLQLCYTSQIYRIQWVLLIYLTFLTKGTLIYITALHTYARSMGLAVHYKQLIIYQLQVAIFIAKSVDANTLYRKIKYVLHDLLAYQRLIVHTQERKEERKKEKKERKKERKRERKIERRIERKIERKKGRKKERQKERKIERKSERKKERKKERWKDRKKDRKKERQKERQIERQKERKIERK